jgi:hypothetical protein
MNEERIPKEVLNIKVNGKRPKRVITIKMGAAG